MAQADLALLATALDNEGPDDDASHLTVSGHAKKQQRASIATPMSTFSLYYGNVSRQTSLRLFASLH